MMWVLNYNYGINNMSQSLIREHSGTHLICICTDTPLKCMILIGLQIWFNIEKLINIIC
jgi:hypothetical protein